MSGIKRFNHDTCEYPGGIFSEMNREADGDYVLHSDHEADVARLSAEVEAYRKDADRWDWIMSNYYGGDLARTQKIIGQCWTREQMEDAIDKDLAERVDAAMGESA